MTLCTSAEPMIAEAAGQASVESRKRVKVTYGFMPRSTRRFALVNAHGPALGCFVDVCRTRGRNILTSGDIGLLTGPHQISFSEPSSFTMRLSEGERPVFAPEYADRAPEDVMAEPVSYTSASS